MSGVVMKGLSGSKIVVIDRWVRSLLNDRNSSLSVSFFAPIVAC